MQTKLKIKIKQGRERSLTASLEYRLDRMDPLLRQRLGILGIFQGFVSAPVLQEIGNDASVPELLKGLDQEKWEEMLSQAAEIGILQKLANYFYRIHPALPWFFHQVMKETFSGSGEWLEQRFVNVYGNYSDFLQGQLRENARTGNILMDFEDPEEEEVA